MNSHKSIEAAIDPANKLTFLLDWEITMKCNLDCSYCATDLHGGHNNNTKHPEFEKCKQSLDFMFEYVDLQLRGRIAGLKSVVLNVYGGEALHHPDIVEILRYAKNLHKQYQEKWHLTVGITTNAIVSTKKWKLILPLTDEITVSYHPETTLKQKEQFKKNVLDAVNNKKSLKCVVLMHARKELFDDCQLHIKWCNEHKIRLLERQLDHNLSRIEFNYSAEQIVWFDKLYQSRSYNNGSNIPQDILSTHKGALTTAGRACCGGRQLCSNQDYKKRHGWINNNNFQGWQCSVDKFFLFVKQLTGEVFVNKDCKMNYQGKVGPIGIIDQSDLILENLKNGTPTIVCAKEKCLCGICAPKAVDYETYLTIIRKYNI